MAATTSRAGSPAASTTSSRRKDDLASGPAETAEEEIPDQDTGKTNTEAASDDGVSVPPFESAFGLMAGSEYNDDQVEYDVVLIHGLQDDPDRVFRKGSGRSVWVSEDLIPFDGQGLLWFSYETLSSEAVVYSGYGLDVLARELLDGLNTIRERRQKAGRNQLPIFFVSRDLGGVIAKQALLIAAREPATYQYIAVDTTIMVFFDCPHTLSTIDKTEDWLWNHMPLSDSGSRHAFKDRFTVLVETVYESTNDVLRSNLLAGTANFNYVSSSSLERKLALDFIINNRTWLHNPFDSNCRYLAGSETGAGREISETDEGIKIPTQVAYPIGTGKCNDIFLPKRRQEMIAECPPPWISDLDTHWNPAFWTWLTDQEAFQSWFHVKYPRRGFRVLHLHGTTPGLPNLTHRVYLGVKASMAGSAPHAAFHFQFHRRDHRRNTMHSMFVSFITQLCQGIMAWDTFSAGNFDLMNQFEALSIQNLVQCWEDFSWSLLSESNRLIFIVGGVDQCTEDVSWFFDRLRERGEKYREDPIEILFTTQGDGDHAGGYESYPSIDVDDFMREYDDDYRQEVFAELSKSQKKMARRHHIDGLTQNKVCIALWACGHDVQRGRMILEWVARSREQLVSEDEIRKGVESFEATSLLGLFRSIQKLYPEHPRDFIEAAISVVQHALKPLKLIELASALSVSDKLEDKPEADEVLEVGSTLEKLDQLIPGVLVVRFGEVFFPHDELATQLDNETSASSHHAAMTVRCLNYLQFQDTEYTVREMIEQDSSKILPFFPGRNSWAAYCVWNLVTHYKLAGADAPRTEMRSFFESIKAKELWFQAYRVLCHRGKRLPRSYMSPLPVLARAGLHELLVQMVDETEICNSADFRTDCSHAMAEAAIRGDTATVGFLMDRSMPDSEGMRDIMTAASRNGDADLLEYLLDRAKSLLPSFKPPAHVLFCAVHSGFDAVLKLVLESDPDAQQTLRQERDINALNLAIRGKHYGACKILLEHGPIDLNVAMEPSDFTPLEAAATWGHAGIMELLLEKGADSTLEDRDNSRPLQQAASRGSFGVVEALLKHGAETSWTVEDEGHDHSWNHGVPLHTAASMGYPKTARILLDHGAKVSTLSYLGTPLNGAVGANDTTMVKLLLESEDADVNLSAPTVMPPLVSAINSQNITVVKLLIEAGADVNYTSPTAELPLFRATRLSRADIVELLLANGADINKKCLLENKGWPPTRFAYVSACGMEDDTMFHLLRSHGPEINRDWDGEWSPLFNAAYYAREDRVDMLLDDGAEVNVVVNDPKGWTPLIASYDNVDGVKRMLEKGADVNHLAGDTTILLSACYFNQPEMVEMLLKTRDQYKLDLELHPFKEEGPCDTPLASALFKGYTGIAGLLLDAGADPNNPGKGKDSNRSEESNTYPIHICLNNTDIDYHTPETLRTLLEYHPRLDVRNADGDLPLHRIMERTPASIIRTLVNAGASIESRNRLGSTALEIAAYRGNIKVVEYLISKGANIHGSADLKAPSALRRAVQGQPWNEVMIKVLVDAGADVHEMDKGSGESILYAVFENASNEFTMPNVWDTVNYLVKNKKVSVSGGVDTNKKPIMAAVKRCNPGMLEFLLEEGADINSQDEAGRRVMHLATKNSLAKPIEFLLSQKPDLKAVDKLGLNVLHHAAANKALGALTMLLEEKDFGLDINAVDIDGWTPLMWACRVEDAAVVAQLVDLLVKHGADVWIRSKNPYQEWSPIKILRYTQFDSPYMYEDNKAYMERIYSLLVPEEKTRASKDDEGELEAWDDDFHRIEAPGTTIEWLCEHCDCACNGILWQCDEHSEDDIYRLCYKCYEHRAIVHPEHDRFTSHGTKFKPPLSSRSSSRGSGDSKHSENQGDENNDEEEEDDDSDGKSASTTSEDDQSDNDRNDGKDEDEDDENSDSDDSRAQRMRTRRRLRRRRLSDDDDDDEDEIDIRVERRRTRNRSMS